MGHSPSAEIEQNRPDSKSTPAGFLAVWLGLLAAGRARLAEQQGQRRRARRTS
jgi:hypothetical protein